LGIACPSDTEHGAQFGDNAACSCWFWPDVEIFLPTRRENTVKPNMQIPDTESRLVRALLIAAPVAWLVAATWPELMRDRIFPFDSALIAANGGLFQRMFAEFGQFLTAPVDWLWAYYDQYPALSVRRHPPLFGFVAGIIYALFGMSTLTAKLTVMLFGFVFAVGAYFVSRRVTQNNWLAFCAALLIVATPQITLHFYSIWLDIPSLASAIWVFVFYLRRLDGDRSTTNAMGMVVFTVLALYTYQPTVVLLAVVFVHLLFHEWRTILKDRSMWIGAILLILMMLPLIAFTLYFAKDNLTITTGEIPEEWKEFSSPTYAQWMVRDKLSIAYWIAYGRMIVQSYPIQFVGFWMWVLLRFVRKPTLAETLMFTCTVVTYIGFSWLVVKGHRYTLYMMLPASILTVTAMRDLLGQFDLRKLTPTAVAGCVILVCTLLQSQLVGPYAPYQYLSGVHQPVAQILGDNAYARILYSGRNDAAFVFYTRSLDDRRAARVHRASVQLAEPDQLHTYIRANNIEFIVVETENPGYDTLEVLDQFRDAILDYVGSDSGFALQANYRLPYGVDGPDGHVLLNVYRLTP
jgi:hypothetical protein